MRDLPGYFVEPAEPAAEAVRDRTPLSPQLRQPTRLGHDDEIDVRALVGFSPRQRALEQQRANPVIALGPARAGLDDRLLPADAHVDAATSGRHTCRSGRSNSPRTRLA